MDNVRCNEKTTLTMTRRMEGEKLNANFITCALPRAMRSQKIKYAFPINSPHFPVHRIFF